MVKTAESGVSYLCDILHDEYSRLQMSNRDKESPSLFGDTGNSTSFYSTVYKKIKITWNCCHTKTTSLLDVMSEPV
jgi:hypothetical protein